MAKRLRNKGCPKTEACRLRALGLYTLIFLFLVGCHPTNTKGPQRAHEAQPSDIRLVNIASQAGLAYHWTISDKHPYNILDVIGNGCAFLDYNNDGNLDILLVGPQLALYKGDGHGHFTDVTHETGLDKIHGRFLGCAVGDYDNDGYDDIYISGYRTGVLLHNDHGRRFVDVTAQSGIKPLPWGTSCAWGDIDNDGRLDLYICNYVQFGPDTKPQLCTTNGILTACGPYTYKPLKGVLYRNLGGGRFQDVTGSWGADKVSGKGLGAAFADFDGSGRQSLAIANDEMPGDLLLNTGGHFTNIGPESGTAFNQQGLPHGGMGIDWGDYGDTGALDLGIGTFRHEPKDVYKYIGKHLFFDQSHNLGIADITAPMVAFGLKWADFTNSGYLDLIIANGDIADNIDKVEQGSEYRQPTQLFENQGGSKLLDVSNSSGADLARPIVGRGLATGDFDNDGKIDALVVDSEGSPILLHNESPNAGHWLEIHLTGTRDNRDGYGAILTASIGKRSLMRVCHSDGSYLSSSDKRVHFGLGTSTSIDQLTVRWPSGHIDTLKNIPCDRIITIKEGL